MRLTQLRLNGLGASKEECAAALRLAASCAALQRLELVEDMFVKWADLQEAVTRQANNLTELYLDIWCEEMPPSRLLSLNTK